MRSLRNELFLLKGLGNKASLSEIEKKGLKVKICALEEQVTDCESIISLQDRKFESELSEKESLIQELCGKLSMSVGYGKKKF